MNDRQKPSPPKSGLQCGCYIAWPTIPSPTRKTRRSTRYGGGYPSRFKHGGNPLSPAGHARPKKFIMSSSKPYRKTVPSYPQSSTRPADKLCLLYPVPAIPLAEPLNRFQ